MKKSTNILKLFFSLKRRVGKNFDIMSLFKKAFISSDRGARDDPRPLRQKDPIKADSQVLECSNMFYTRKCLYIVRDLIVCC